MRSTFRRPLVLILLVLLAGGLLSLQITSRAAAPGQAVSGSPVAGDWPWWRGPARDGVAPASAHPPLKWSETENVLWKTEVPGRGHASPTVVGGRIFLSTADEQQEVQSVLCYDRKTGRQLWKVDVHSGGFERRGHKKNSQASATVACDGERVFANFLHDGAIYTTALDLQGKQVWQTRISDFVTHQGFGSSPALYEKLVIVATDNKAGGVIAALDSSTGKIVWKHARPEQPNYTSPIILPVAGRDQLLLAGCDHVSSFDPLTGKPLWEVEASTTECVGTIVTDGALVFASGGYPKQLTQAIAADGSNKIVWQNETRTYVPSMLVHDGCVFTVTDAGIAYCWKSTTGEELWKARLGGTFNTSPVLVGELIYATNQEGKTFIFKANRAKYELVAENELGEDVYATPTFLGSQIFMRVAHGSGSSRQEWLYCLGEAKK
jgi:outer membrane protein assembly factor BamB